MGFLLKAISMALALEKLWFIGKELGEISCSTHGDVSVICSSQSLHSHATVKTYNLDELGTSENCDIFRTPPCYETYEVSFFFLLHCTNNS